jgi:hypothetical protein
MVPALNVGWLVSEFQVPAMVEVSFSNVKVNLLRRAEGGKR